MASPFIRINLSCQELELENPEKSCSDAPSPAGRRALAMKKVPGKLPQGISASAKNRGRRTGGYYFISRLPAGRYPTAIPKNMDEHSDFILTRILWLDGLEPHNANTRSRYIYIHGTNDTELLGTPASHGCIRLSPRDMLALFALSEEGMDVFIQC